MTRRAYLPCQCNVEHIYRITPNNPQGSYFFEVGKKGGGVIRGGSYSGDGELLFRVGNFAEKFMFSIEIGISHDDENGIGIWQQRITALEQVEITLWRPIVCF